MSQLVTPFGTFKLTQGKRLGRPHVTVDLVKVTSLRDSGASWRTISKQMGLSVGKLHKAFQQRS